MPKLASDPWIVFPGNLQSRHMRETGPKGATLDEYTIRKACFLELPRYKQPAHVRIVDSLPKSDRGKVLRRELSTRRLVAAPDSGG